MPKVTLNNFERTVSREIYHRGKNYYNTGKVLDLKESQTNKWEGMVKGSYGRYTVYINLEEDFKVTNYRCTCPYDWGGMCKHVVACLLEIKQQKYHELNQFEDASTTRRSIFTNTKASPKKVISRSTKELIVAYQKLSSAEKRILKIAAVAWEPVSQTKFMEIFNACGFKYEDKRLYAPT